MFTAKQWIDEIAAARRREKDFRKKGKDVLEIYESEDTDQTPFNILYSNTEVLAPAIYSQTPRPVIKRRFNDEDPMGKVVSEAGKRMLEYLIDPNIEGYEKYDDSMSAAVLDALLPGRGTTSVYYDDDGDDLKWPHVCASSSKWDRFYHGYALKWTDVPWICYEFYPDKTEAKKLIGNKVEKLQFTAGEEEDEKAEEQSTGGRDDIDSKGQKKTTQMYQIWVKKDKQVIYVSPNCDEILGKQDDPLKISGFFNCPKPLRFVRKSNNLKPTALYCFYENQAKELNRLTRRLNHVIEAIKARGFVDGVAMDDLNKLMDEEDGVLYPTENASALSERALKDRIWFMPISELIATAQQLYQAREACKRVIYEITGVSDIIRGQSMASETLGAQKIKEAWGTMRLKNMQKDAQYYARDTLRIMLEIAANKFPERFWAKVTGLPLNTEKQQKNAEQTLKALKAEKMQFEAQLQTIEPDQNTEQAAVQLKQQLEQAKKEASKPQWKDILAVLKDDFIRSYKIDIETNSTLDVEATEDQKLVGDFMNAMAQFMNGIAPLIQDGSMPFSAAKSMLLAITRRYRFGTEVEDEINAMQEPKRANPDEIKKQQQELQKAQKKFQEEQKRAGDDLDKQHLDLQKREMQLDFERKLMQQEDQFNKKILDNENKMEEVKLKGELESMLVKFESKVQGMIDKSEARMKNAAV